MPRKRRSFSAEFKAQVVLELISGKNSLLEASREYNIKDTVLSRWKQEFVGKASQVFEQPQEVQEKEARIAELERMVGKLTMQIELQKKVLSLADSLARDNEDVGGSVWVQRAGSLRSDGTGSQHVLLSEPTH